MEVFQAIQTRRSVRKFLEIPVEWEKIGAILDAGRLAPSSGNLQTWRFIVVRDPAKKQEVADGCLQQKWIGAAPYLIVVCAELTKIRQFYGLRGDRLYSIQNCSCAIQNMLLVAHSLGLGSCFVAAFDENMIARALSIPDESRPQAVLPIGYPDEQPNEPVHYRIDNVTFFEKYGNRVSDIDKVLGTYRISDHAKNLAGGITKLLQRGIDAAKTRKREK